MDLVKHGHGKVKEGDCVSSKSNYFGKEFEKCMHKLGFADGIIYGWVTEVKDANRDLNVTWDMDGQVLKHMTLEKVKLRSRDIPKQIVESSVIITDDFQTVEQCSSKTGAPYTCSFDWRLWCSKWKWILLSSGKQQKML